MRSSYKYFQKGDKIIGNGKRRFRIFRESLSICPKPYMVYTFQGYVPGLGGKTLDYNLLMTEETDYIFDGYEFMSMLEYRKLQLKKLKRKMFFNKIFRK